MKRLIEVTKPEVKLVELDETGLESLMNEDIWILCSGYFYRGHLIGVNKDSVILKDARIIYDAGNYVKTGEEQVLPSKEWFVATSAIESFGKAK